MTVSAILRKTFTKLLRIIMIIIIRILVHNNNHTTTTTTTNNNNNTNHGKHNIDDTTFTKLEAVEGRNLAGGGNTPTLRVISITYRDLYLYCLKLYWYEFALTFGSYQLLELYWYAFDQILTNKAPTSEGKSHYS